MTAPARDAGIGAPSLVDSPELVASPTDDIELGKKPGFLYTRFGMFVTRVVTAIIIFGGWEWYAQGVSKALLVPPSRIITEAYDMLFVDGRLVGALQISVGTMLIGLFLSIIIGIPLGMIMGRFKTIEAVLDPYVLFLYVLPSVAFVPVFVVMVGIDIKLRLALIIMSAVFPLIINTIAGVKHVDSELIDGGKSFTANEWQIMRTILIPGSLPFIFAGLRIGFSAAWVGAIVAEMTALITGVGGLLLDSSSKYRTSEVFVSIFAIMAVAVTIQWLTARLEHWVTPWARAGNEAH